jgi:NAD(P)-dependent dehydrogenase (short-subunit alcohol dehydrogenase family)
LVTGASRGIGAAAAEHLARCGATVVLAARDLDLVTQNAKRITDAGGQAHPFRLDIADDDSVRQCVEWVESQFGALHLAFNNAGVQADPRPIHEVDAKEAERVIDINLLGTIRCLRHEVPAMLRVGGGVILNTASVGALVAAPGIGAYCASKHGIVGISKSAALDYARENIRINVLAPGAVRTQILTGWLSDEAELAAMADAAPQGRIAEPAEIAPIVGWLLSDASTFMTGAVVTADGGYTVA